MFIRCNPPFSPQVHPGGNNINGFYRSLPLYFWRIVETQAEGIFGGFLENL
jgi:hypothetical protein